MANGKLVISGDNVKLTLPSDCGLSALTIAGDNAAITIPEGIALETVTVSGNNAEVTNSGTISTLVCGDTCTIVNGGTISALTINAEKCGVTNNADATINSITINGKDSTITNGGIVNSVGFYADSTFTNNGIVSTTGDATSMRIWTDDVTVTVDNNGEIKNDQYYVYWIEVNNAKFIVNDYVNAKYSVTSSMHIELVVTQSGDNTYSGSSIDRVSVWNGKVPTKMPDSLVVDGKTCTIHVNDAAAFAYLSTLFKDWTGLYTDGNGNEYSNYVNGKGSNYYYGGRWTIFLDADIDLNNKNIDPVTIKFPTATGTPTFDGQSHTIKNAVIITDPSTENEAGLFNAGHSCIKNLKLDSIHVTGSCIKNSNAGVLTGSAHSGVYNIIITDSSVTGGKYTGGVVGYGYTDVTNCHLTNVEVKGGYKMGGIIGYICASSGTGDVTGNTLTYCTVDGIVDNLGNEVFAGGKSEHIIGKLVGNYDCNGACTDNTVTNMITSATNDIGKIEAGKSVTQ